MTYDCRVDRDHPGALIFMIDQSTSMADNMVGAAVSKSSIVAEQINGLLFELVQRCTKSIGEPPRPYFAVGIVGYRTDIQGQPIVGTQLQGSLSEQMWAWTSDLAEHPLRIETRVTSDDTGGRQYRMPIWIDAVANGGTPMCNAFDTTGRMLKTWCGEYPDAFPPVVINLTDGEATDGDPSTWADRIKSLATNDGNVLLFNLEIGGEGPPTAFNSTVPQGGRSELLWNMSSELPSFMLEIAAAQGFTVEDGSRGFACNADFRSVVSFLNVGTSIGSLLR